MEPRTLELRENESTALAEEALTEAEVAALEASGFFEIEYPSVRHPRQYLVRSPRTVGLIPIGPDLMIRIVPKVSIGNLLGMMEWAYDLRSLEFYDGLVQVEAIESIYEHLAILLAEGVLRRCRRGLHSDYVEVVEALPHLRGRLLIEATLRYQIAGSTALACQHTLRTVDIDDNGILLAALDRIPRLGVNEGPAFTVVRQARRALAGAVSLREYSGSDCLHRRYDRLNADYAPLHALSRFFLETMGPGLDSGKHEFLPFSINMPVLFEKFISAVLADRLDPRIVVVPQHQVEVSGNLELTLRIDLALFDVLTGTALAVVDAKYKASSSPDRSDVFQVVAYAARLGVPLALLVYPQAQPVRRSGTFGAVRVAAVGCDLAHDLESGIGHFVKALTANLTVLD